MQMTAREQVHRSHAALRVDQALRRLDSQTVCKRASTFSARCAHYPPAVIVRHAALSSRLSRSSRIHRLVPMTTNSGGPRPCQRNGPWDLEPPTIRYLREVPDDLLQDRSRRFCVGFLNQTAHKRLAIPYA
ncbi:hypothetical protein LIA77_11348 [Sarocladium implicatum]|nr:hypothetical protein LIA77_11348 [Sarocladium implicatum]